MKRIGRLLLAWAFPFTLLGAWEFLAWAGFLQGRWPSVGTVVGELAADWHGLLRATCATVWQVAQAAALGVLLGTPLGVLLAATKRKLGGVYATFAGLKAVPVTILIPVFLSVFGLELFIVPLVALPLLLNFSVNTAEAVAQASKTRLLLLRSWSVPHKVYLKHVLPFECLDALLQTARVMLPFAFALHIALDYFLCISEGLGCYVQSAHVRYEHGRMYAAMLVVAVLGLCLGKGIDLVSKRLLLWKRDM